MLPAAFLFDADSTLLWALVLGYSVATLLTVLLAVYVGRRHWETEIGRVFTMLVGALGVWIFGSFVRLFTTDPEAFVAISTFKFVGVATAPVLFVLFALLYAGYGHLVTGRVAATLLVPPALELLALATTLSHRLFYTEFIQMSLGSVPILETTVGPAFWLFAAYGWGLLIVGSVIFVVAAIKRSGLYREQAAVVIFAILVSWAANVAYVVWDWPHPALDPTPFGFAVSSLLLTVGIFTTRLIDVVPAARSLVLDAIEDSVIVLDPQERIVDANETARDRFDLNGAIGEPAATVLPSALREPPTDEPATIDLSDAGERRHVRYRRIPIGPDGTLGNAIVLTDLTSQVRMHRDLERQNEQLAEFTSVVSHDLRNPLNVAEGNLELAREAHDSEQLEAVHRAHTRMTTLIEDLLTLARQGQAVGAVEPVDLRGIARDAWGTVESGAATLELDEERLDVRADENRLTQLFENLFRNAVEHGGPDVTVRVGPMAGGFYVEDDGPGLDDPTSVFDRGVTTKEAGTGFGLAIVESIVEAHGWSIDTTEAASGGARFEVTSVEAA